MILTWYVILAFMLTVFILLEGFDIGAGMLLYVVGSNDAQRREIIDAIGPLWSWSEVWLVAFGGTLFLAFPSVLAASFAGFYLAFFLLLVLIKLIVRNQWLAVLVFLAIQVTPRLLGSDHIWLDFFVWLLVFAIAALAVVRFGLIALGIGVFLADVLLNVPYSLDFSNWYAAHNLLIVFSFFAIGVWGFYLSLGGQKLLKPEFFDR